MNSPWEVAFGRAAAKSSNGTTTVPPQQAFSHAHPRTYVKGVRITPLPLSTAELPSGLPKRNDIRRSAYLGHAVLSVDTVATPALFRPVSKHQQAVRGKLPQGLDFDLICQAVSLECDASIDTGVGWNDYGDLNVLTSNRTTWGSLLSGRRHGVVWPAGWCGLPVGPEGACGAATAQAPGRVVRSRCRRTQRCGDRAPWRIGCSRS